MKSLSHNIRLLRRAIGPLAAVLVLAGCDLLLDPDEPGHLVRKTVVEDATLPRIAVNGTLLHAQSVGDPSHPLVLVLHGGPGADFQSLTPLRALADDGYHVVFWDQRGAGLSQRHDPGVYSLALYLEDLRRVVEHYSQEPSHPFVFIGHSWGAMYATMFINEYGDYSGRLRGNILSEPGAFTDRQLDAYFDRLFGSLDLFGEQLNDAAWMGQFMTAEDHERADYMAMVQTAGGLPAEHVDPTAPEWRFGAVVADRMLEIADEDGFDWTTHFSAFPHPVLFLRSALNEAMPIEHQQELAASYPDAEIITIPGVGHEMIWERPGDYLRHTRAYLQRIGFEGGAQ